MSNTSFLLKPGQTWVLLGDSITEDPAGYASICSRLIEDQYPELELRIINAGVSGNKARDMVARFERDVLSCNPDWVSISVGVNDVMHGFYDFERDRPLSAYDPALGEELSEYKDDLEWMADELESRGINYLLISPTMIGEKRDSDENLFLTGYVHAMKEVAEKRNVLYCPMNEAMWEGFLEARRSDPHSQITSDGVHMTTRGAKMMAATLLVTMGF
jgi:lysophospholipase L1-like esterase